MAGDDERMEVSAPEQQGPLKRKLVDPEGQEMQDTKKARIDINTEKKGKMLLAICKAAKALYNKVDIPNKSYRNIPINIQIANILFTCHTVLRQAVQEPAVTRNTAAKIVNRDFTVHIAGTDYILKKEDALKAVSDSMKDQGFEYKKYEREDRNNWYGMAGPYLDFFAGLGYRLQELRLGHDEMSIRKEANGRDVRFKVSSYGIMPSHHVLLEGIGFPPEKRASMAQSMGPLTALLLFLRTDGQYRHKWEAAAARALGHIPYHKDLLNVLKGKSAFECSSIITPLADTLLIVGSRNAHRVFFPVLPFMAAMAKNKTAADPIGIPVAEDLSKVNFSGDGAFYAYKKMCELGSYVMYGEMTDTQARQIMYHSMFGTFKEDLNLLKEITNLGTWSTRSELGNCFRGMGNSSTEVSFQLVEQKYYSKLASANISGMLSASYTQLSFQGVFSGKRSQTFSKRFFDSIGRGMGISSGVRTIDDLQIVSRKVLKEVIKKINSNNNKLNMGTVEWKDVASLTLGGRGNPVTIREPTTHKYFLGPSEEEIEDVEL